MMHFDIFKRCKKYGIRIWECPQFLFLMMGVIIIVAIIGTNIAARSFVETEIVPLIILGVTGIFFVISYIIISSFERVTQSSIAKSEFISIMSHQLRTPLSGIKWQMSLVLDKKVNLNDEKIKTFLSEINEENEKMIRIVNDLLEINRIEDKSLILMPISFSLKELIEKITPSGVSVSVPENLPEVFADRIRIKNVLFHLIDNARCYTSDKARILIALKELPGYIQCSIKDEGIGISKEESKRVFTKFFRGENITRYKTKGIGIGLYISKYIIDVSGGKMGFISTESKGSMFWFTLPITKVENNKH